MGELASFCPECGGPIRVVFHDRSLETLYLVRACTCAAEEPPVLVD